MTNNKKYRRRVEKSLKRQGYKFEAIEVSRLLSMVMLGSMWRTDYLHLRRGWLHGRMFEVGDKLDDKFIRRRPQDVNQILVSSCGLLEPKGVRA